MDTLFWQLSIDHNIAVQSVFSWAPWDPKVARKRESKHWYACGADGRRSVGVRSRDCKIFLGWVDTYPWCSADALRARESSAIIKFSFILRAPFSLKTLLLESSTTRAKRVRRTVEVAAKLRIRRSRKQRYRYWPHIGHKISLFVCFFGFFVCHFFFNHRQAFEELARKS